MSIAICPGSFDPVTKGHINIIERTSKLFDKVIVLVVKNANKMPAFSSDQRVDFLKRCTANMGNVTVESYDGLLVNFAKERNADVIVKGIRAVTDFEYEFQMSLINKKLNPKVETMFLNTDSEYMYLSSSIVREVASMGSDISEFVPECICDEVCQRFKK